jgi:hypothetical protein
MEVGVGFGQRDDSHRGRQQGIQGSMKLFFIQGGLSLEVGRLGLSMDTGVRPPGSYNMGFLVEDSFQGLFNHTLNRLSSGLALPAVKICSVIAEDEFVVNHLIPCFHSFSRLEKRETRDYRLPTASFTASSAVPALMTPSISQVPSPMTFFQ